MNGSLYAGWAVSHERLLFIDIGERMSVQLKRARAADAQVEFFDHNLLDGDTCPVTSLLCQSKMISLIRYIVDEFDFSSCLIVVIRLTTRQSLIGLPLNWF